MSEEPIDAEVVEEPGQELAVRATSQLVHAADPAEFIVRAQEIAKALVDVIEQKKLYAVISGRKHVQVEGWTLLGSMMGAFGEGVYAVEDWTRPIMENGAPIGWEARVVAKTLSGNEVGAAESMCTRKESKWRTRDDYALRSMAQTRAASKALRMPLGFIVQLAGYEATPLEEMPPPDEPAAPPEPTVAPNMEEIAAMRQTLERGIEQLYVQQRKPEWALDSILASASVKWGRAIDAVPDLTPSELEQIINGMKSAGASL